ncbi:DUF3348 domain-containing protein [Dyella halodurans]|uniref:DUF3348 domain-containing protein n=1 Tax=Dyella halodurans TaxID=1920171 RepID=A0ABV9BZA6_9GAMM|nr:DUF3348 domain-containing protein [Dyella halodurans]
MVRGPTFIRLLARLSDVDAPQSNASLSDRLSQWLDWKHALALSTALDGKPSAAPAEMPTVASSEEDECARLRASLAEAIASKPEATVSARRATRRASAAEDADGAVDYTVFRQRYLQLQRTMQAATGNLRGRLRDRLAQQSAELARLAEVDAVMELALSPREQTLLASVPALLGEHFERLRQAEQIALADAAAVETTSTAMPGAWLDVFRKDMQSVLLAELDVRFQPVEGLLAALRTR